MEAASILLRARMDQKRIDCLPESCCPKDLSSAYKCQNELTELMSKHYDGKIVGYKTACTNESAQKLMGLNGPFYGPLLSSFVHKSPIQLNTNDFFMRVIEPEFAFQMAADLPPREKEYSKDEVSKAVGTVIPSIEIVDSRYNDWRAKHIGALSLIADNACNGAWISGEAKNNWTDFDLANQEVDLWVNGNAIRKGHGSAVMGHPLNPLTWLANMLAKSGKGLKAGDLITTGITTEVYLAERGDHIMANFGPIGTVEVSFT